MTSDVLVIDSVNDEILLIEVLCVSCFICLSQHIHIFAAWSPYSPKQSNPISVCLLWSYVNLVFHQGGSCLLSSFLQPVILLSEVWLGEEACWSQGRSHAEQPNLNHPEVVWGNGQHLQGLKHSGVDLTPFDKRQVGTGRHKRCLWNPTGRLGSGKFEQEEEQKGRRHSRGWVCREPQVYKGQRHWDWC